MSSIIVSCRDHSFLALPSSFPFSLSLLLTPSLFLFIPLPSSTSLRSSFSLYPRCLFLSTCPQLNLSSVCFYFSSAHIFAFQCIIQFYLSKYPHLYVLYDYDGLDCVVFSEQDVYRCCGRYVENAKSYSSYNDDDDDDNTSYNKPWIKKEAKSVFFPFSLFFSRSRSLFFRFFPVFSLVLMRSVFCCWCW